MRPAQHKARFARERAAQKARVALRRPRLTRARVSLAIVALAFTGCASPAPVAPTPGPASPSRAAVAPPLEGGVEPVGAPTVLAVGLRVPWSMVLVEGRSALISERDTARILEFTDGSIREVGVIAGVDPGGEGGLLGIDTLIDGNATWLYAYFTAPSDNRIVRMPLLGTAGALSLGTPSEVLTGIAKASNHNGGRIKFGPDGYLYATSGDAGNTRSAQDSDSLSGKILRMTATGAPADDTLVYSLGHRNPQGIAWDASGHLWATEFGQNTWDELNVIQEGGNYGWPVVEGTGTNTDYLNPVALWSTSDASPSGLAYTQGTFFMAALRGQALWSVSPGGEASAWYTGDFGRLRDVIPGPDGTLWVLTNNTDGRGNPNKGDDKLLEIQLRDVSAG
ncbi:MAG: glucose dehydrogenase [Homoserinimonas sp.]|nr:glucose dehydrogenase [Homoserinimonas sp.]